MRAAILDPGREGDERPQRGPAEIRAWHHGQYGQPRHRQRRLRGDAAAGSGHERACGAARLRRYPAVGGFYSALFTAAAAIMLVATCATALVNAWPSAQIKAGERA